MNEKDINIYELTNASDMNKTERKKFVMQWYDMIWITWERIRRERDSEIWDILEIRVPNAAKDKDESPCVWCGSFVVGTLFFYKKENDYYLFILKLSRYPCRPNDKYLIAY